MNTHRRWILDRRRLVLSCFLAIARAGAVLAITTTEGAQECVGNTTARLSASPGTIKLGGSTTISWSVTVSSKCPVGTGVRLHGRPVAASGSIDVRPMHTQRYPLELAIITGQGLPVLRDVWVTVELPPVVAIKQSDGEWKGLLVQAVGEPNKTVLLADGVDMDLTDYFEIRVASGVILTGGPNPRPLVGTSAAQPFTTLGPAMMLGADRLTARGGLGAAGGVLAGGGVRAGDSTATATGRDARNLGPRIFVKPRPAWLSADEKSRPLFRIEGGNVRFSGFRLHGPHFGVEGGDENLERAISIDPGSDAASPASIEITNMEVAGWSGVAIEVKDDNEKIAKPADVTIRGNFIHHNQHDDKNGYGVAIDYGAWALVERNVFDFNRHAITSGRRPEIGYDARENLVLKGGGVHCPKGICAAGWHTQEFDVHGSDNCGPRVSNNVWNCGPAGEQFWVVRNAFQYRAGPAFKLRGTPVAGADVMFNVFAHGSLSDAIQQTETGMRPAANKTGVDSFGQYGVCDFDGDGKDDLFLPTEVTWWFSSAGRMHWSHLNTAEDRLADIGLGDFDGDRRCDVFAVHRGNWEISSGGTAPWKSLGPYGVPIDQLRFGDFDGDGITDVFRRTPAGDWFAISPGHYDWRKLGSSSFPLRDLRFGYFNDDRVTDVMAVTGGKWSVSFGGTTPWEVLNPNLSTNLAGLMIADLNANGTDDVARIMPVGTMSVRWEVSWEGRSGWKQLKIAAWPSQSPPPLPRYFLFAGRFDGSPGADLLAIKADVRTGKLYSAATDTVVQHDLFEY
jgi:hypothetical protein